MNERFVQLDRGDGTRVTARVRAGKGPNLILVPGTWGNMDTRGPLMERLDPELNIVNVALPGQDDNWPPPKDPSIPAFTADVLRLADHLGLERFFIGGNSLGGMISIDMIRLAEQRLLGVITLEGWTHWSALYDAFGDNTEVTLNPQQSAFLQEVRRKLLDRWDPGMRSRYATMWREWDGSETLQNCTVPLLSIWGDRGKPRPARDKLKVPVKPNIEFLWVANASHNLLVEAPEIVADAMNAFIRRHNA